MRKWMICAAIMMAAWTVSSEALAQQVKGTKAVKQTPSGQTVKAPERSLETQTKKSAANVNSRKKFTPAASAKSATGQTTTVQPKSATVQSRSTTVRPATVPVKSKVGAKVQESATSKRSADMKMKEKRRSIPKAKVVSSDITVKKGSVFDGRNVKVKNQEKTKK